MKVEIINGLKNLLKKYGTFWGLMAGASLILALLSGYFTVVKDDPLGYGFVIVFMFMWFIAMVFNDIYH